MSVNNYDRYSWYKQRKEALAGMLTQASDVIGTLNMPAFSQNLAVLGEKVENDTFKIMVCGTFKNGKSTFINALLGEDVLPAYAVPCTAVINEVKYGEKKRAIVHFRNPLPENLCSSISEPAMAHIKAHGMKDVPPMEIPYDQLEDYVTIPMGEDPTDMIRESPFEKIELFYPCPLLREGVEIIDSPGLNEHETRTRNTMNYLAKADAVIMVLNATVPCAATEISFIENSLEAGGFNDIFFVVNRWDLITNERDRTQIPKFFSTKIGSKTTKPIYYVSSFNGLNAKTAHDQAAYTASGLKAVEADLQHYLATQKGKAKLTQPARELSRVLSVEVMGKAIPQERAMLSSSLDSVRTRYDAACPTLEALRRRKELLMATMRERIAKSHTVMRRSALNFLRDVADKAPAWIADYSPNSPLSVIPRKIQVEAIAKEINDYVSDRIYESKRDWETDVLRPDIEERAAYIFDSVTADLSRLFEELDSVSADISGREFKATHVSAIERIIGVVGGIALGSGNLAVLTGSLGFSKELAKAIALEVGAFTVLGLLGLLNPYTWIAVAVGGLMFGQSQAANRVIAKIKENVTTQTIKQIAQTSPDIAERVADEICHRMEEIADLIGIAVDKEIEQAEAQAKAILDEMSRGQQAVDSRLAALTQAENKLKTINDSLRALVFELAELN